MKKIASFTQTHGNSRVLNFELLKHDVIGQYIRNNCDIIIFSFHNCPDDIYDKKTKIINSLFEKEKIHLLRFNNCTYLECILNFIKYAKDLNITDILQIQDDEHGINSIENTKNIFKIDEIIEHYRKSVDIKHLCLFSDECIPKKNLVPIETIEYKSIIFYKYNSRDFKNENIYSWNDGVYIIDINLLDNLFNLTRDNLEQNPQYSKTINGSCRTIDFCELFLKNVYDNNSIVKYGTNQIIFKASNLYGWYINKTMTPENNLFRFFGELNSWPNIKELVNQYLQ